MGGVRSPIFLHGRTARQDLLVPNDRSADKAVQFRKLPIHIRVPAGCPIHAQSHRAWVGSISISGVCSVPRTLTRMGRTTTATEYTLSSRGLSQGLKPHPDYRRIARTKVRAYPNASRRRIARTKVRAYPNASRRRIARTKVRAYPNTSRRSRVVRAKARTYLKDNRNRKQHQIHRRTVPSEYTLHSRCFCF
jgi:hypothetical protein